jgi:hypothetical protein
MLVLPFLVVAATVTLTAADLNGSSVAAIDRVWQDDPDLVAGTPRRIRSDEYGVSTPAQVSNALRGNPPTAWVGLTDTDLAATSLGAATTSWSSALSPQSWPLLALPVDTGFALRWWMLVAVGVLGTYALLLALRPRALLASTFALVSGVSPVVAWWMGAGPGLILGYLTFAACCVLLATRAGTRRARLPLAALAGLLVVAAFLVLYPPWFIALGLVVAAVVVGDCLERRVPWRRALEVLAVLAAVVAGILGLWLVQHAGAIAAISATYYPGNRIVTSGGGQASYLLSAPLNAILSGGVSFGDERAVNQSEVSSGWLPLPLVLLVVVLALVEVARRRAAPPEVAAPADPPQPATRAWITTLCVSAVLALELAWALLPVPAIIGRLTLLDRVPGGRVAPAVGLACAVVVFLMASDARLRWRSAWPAALVATVALAIPLSLWSGRSLLGGEADLSSAVVLTVLVCGGCAGLALSRWTAPFALVLIATVCWQYAVVNPLYRGLGPLTGSPLARAIDEMDADEPGGRWTTLASGRSQNILAASRPGALSGLTYYPTRSTWLRLAPEQERAWNNLARYRWIQDEQWDPARILQIRGTSMQLRIDLCNPRADFLGITHVVSRIGEAPPCFTPVRTLVEDGERLQISRRSAAPR